MLKIDHTKRTERITCPYKYFLVHEMGVESDMGNADLRYGSAWHAAMYGYYSYIHKYGWTKDGREVLIASLAAKMDWAHNTQKASVWPETFKTLPNLMESLVSFIGHFHADEGSLVVIAPEVTFSYLMKPTDREMRDFPGIDEFLFTGQIDLTLEFNFSPWVTEHKTTGWSIDLATKSLHRSPQMMGYVFADREVFEHDTEGAFLCVHQITSRKTKDGSYGKLTVAFRRVPHVFTDGDLEMWRYGFMSDAYDIQQYRRRQVWPKRFHSCYNYNRLCGLSRLCDQNKPFEELNLDGFHIREPWDVTTEPKINLDILEEIHDDPNAAEKYGLEHLAKYAGDPAYNAEL